MEDLLINYTFEESLDFYYKKVQMVDTFNLQRFLDAQTYDYERALQEIKNGRKQSHWVWYIFPQLKGFGHSYNSEYFGISGLDEAQAYFNHPVLGNRLIEITKALLKHSGKAAQEILSPIDARKVKSCMTLFYLVSANSIFKEVIDEFFEGKMDNKTINKAGNIPSIEKLSESPKTISMLHHFNPFKVEQLDFVIVDRVIRGYHCTEDSPQVTNLYNFFGRWFSRHFIAERIRYIDEISVKENRGYPEYMDADGYMREAFLGLNRLFDTKSKAKKNEDEKQTISIDTEMILEINNLCHFCESHKMYSLLKKYFFTDTHFGNWGIMLKTFKLQRLEGIPRNMILFHWNDNGTPHLWGYMSISDEAYYQSFNFDYSNTNGNDFGDHRLGEYGFIQKDKNLNKILDYSGSDYVSMFRMDGDKIVCCNPPLIRHKYRLKPLYVPGDNFAIKKSPVYFDKYYDLYHSGNWNAKYAIERGGFNLNG